MNTRQKLTLGIAAIFMVTLTVIGVTYAYFVTRVQYTSGTATAVINTAEIGAYFKDDTATVTIDNAIPGEVVYKSFTVNNQSLVDVPFTITLSTKLNKEDVALGTCDGGVEEIPEYLCTGVWTKTKEATDADDVTSPHFVHSTLTDAGTCSDTQYTTEATCRANGKVWTVTSSNLTNACYVSSALTDHNGTTPTNCYDGDYYNNIQVTLYRVKGFNIDNNSDGKITADDFLVYDFNNLAGNTDITENKTQTNTYVSFADITKTVENGGLNVTLENITTDENDNLVSLMAPYDNLTDASGNYTAKDTEDRAVHKISLNKKNGTVQEVLEPKESEEATETVNYYIMKVEYVNVNRNQNIENNASVSLLVDIQSASVTND